MSSQKKMCKKDVESSIQQYIAANKPVTQTEIRNAFDEKVILSLRRLMKANKIEYNENFNLVVKNDE